MSKFFTFVGTTAGSYAGWWLGARVGFMTAFILSIVGTGAGFYYARKAAQHYQP